MTTGPLFAAHLDDLELVVKLVIDTVEDRSDDEQAAIDRLAGLLDRRRPGRYAPDHPHVSWASEASASREAPIL